MAAFLSLPFFFFFIFFFFFSLIFSSSSSNSFTPPFSMSSLFPFSCIDQTMFFSVFFFTLSILSLSMIIFSIYSKKCSNQLHHHALEKQQTQNTFFADNITSSSETYVDNQDNVQTDIHNSSVSDPNQLSHSLLLEMLPSDSSRWSQLFRDDVCSKKDMDLDGDPGCIEEEEEKKKKRKKRGKKKRPDPNVCYDEEKKEELVCLYPFTTSTSATQRKIKHKYDQLVKSHESNGLNLAQVGQFINCLVESKKELQHRAEVTQRKFTIAKALLLKADRSSFDRLCQQIYKLELDQKRIEEDTFVYNWLQQQLKLSPAYKKIVEFSTCMDTKAKSCEQAESTEDEIDDISFEELLAQEKKDAFWQRNGKSKSCSQSNGFIFGNC